MRKALSFLFLLFLLLCTPTLLHGQSGYVAIQVTNFSSVTSSRRVSLIGSPVVKHALNWQVLGPSLSTCQVQVDSSTDGISWNNGDVVPSQLCTSNGSVSPLGSAVSYIRVTVTAISGAGTLTAVWTGYSSGSGGATPAGTLNQIQINDGAGNLGASTCTADTNGILICPGSGSFGPGKPADNTMVVGDVVVWNAATHSYTKATNAKLGLPVIAKFANTNPGGLNDCGIGFTNCIYVPGDDTTINIASGTEGNGVVVNASGLFADGGAVPSSITSGNVVGFLTSSVGGGTATMHTIVGFVAANAVTLQHYVIFQVDGGGSAITTGALGIFPVSQSSGTINKATVSCDQSGSITLDVWKANAAIPGAGNKISSTTPLALAAAQLNNNASLSGWTTGVAAGDVWGASVASAATVTKCTFIIQYQ